MEVKNLFEFTYFNILIENIKEEFTKQNYSISADLSNKLLEKLSVYTNMKEEQKEVLMYKILSDEKIIKDSNINNNTVVLIRVRTMI